MFLNHAALDDQYHNMCWYKGLDRTLPIGFRYWRFPIGAGTHSCGKTKHRDDYNGYTCLAKNIVIVKVLP